MGLHMLVRTVASSWLPLTLHSSTCCSRYQAFIHCESISQNKILHFGETHTCNAQLHVLAMQAALIEYNLEAVDAAINAVREALASGLDWRELGQMIKAERRAGNPVAGLIDSLALDKNKITVVLENFLDEEEADDEAMTRPATKVNCNQPLCALQTKCFRPCPGLCRILPTLCNFCFEPLLRIRQHMRNKAPARPSTPLPPLPASIHHPCVPSRGREVLAPYQCSEMGLWHA